jgi:hypothetical protein
MKRFRGTHLARSSLVVVVLVVSVFVGGGTASATPTPVGLGTATSFAIRATSGVTNTGAGTAITGDVGNDTGAGTQITGLTCTPAQVTGGTIYQVSAGGPTPCTTTNPSLMAGVTADALAAFIHTAALPGATPIVGGILTGQTLDPGIYSFGHLASGNIASGGTLTLNAHGDPSAVWIFQASSDIIMSTTSTVTFTNLPASDPTGALLACNVYWTAVTSASIDTGSSFVGTIMTGASITMTAGSTVRGRLLAGNGGTGNVTLISDTIIRPTGCTTLPAGSGGGPVTPTPTPTSPTIPAPTSPTIPVTVPPTTTTPVVVPSTVALPATPLRAPPTFTG